MVAPKYVAVANELRKEILSGKFGSEGGLPPTSELAKSYDIVVNTAKVALGRLEGEGLIIQRGGNYYVNGLEIVMTRHVPLPEARFQKRVGYVRTLRVARVGIPEHVGRKLNVQSDRTIPMREQVSGEINGRFWPLQFSTRYYFLPLSDEQYHRLEQEAGTDPLWDITDTLLSRDEICSRPATTQEAEHLSLPDGTSIIALFEIIRDANGVLLMAQEITLSPRETLVFEFSFENRPS